jgi:aspartyl/asparaginyl beta-hydroxylase (cupin superfamily)
MSLLVANYPKKEKLVFLKREEKYNGSLPCFYSPEWFPELQPLKDNWTAIRDEILHFEKSNGAITGLDSNPYVAPQFNGVNWSNVFLENFMIRHHRSREKFPVTSSVIDQIPNCSFAVISVLSPHTTILPHYGDTNSIVRSHLGLVIPAGLPYCGARVGNEEQGWADGELTLFTEAYLHGTWNHTDKKRYVLVVDIVPVFHEVSKISVCSNLLGAQSYNYLERRFPFLKNIPDSMLGIFCSFLAFMWRLYLPIQRRVEFL